MSECPVTQALREIAISMMIQPHLITDLRLIARQKQCSIGNVFWPSQRLPRMTAGQLLLAFWCRDVVRDHRSVDEAWVDAVDVDAVLRVVNRHLLGHSDNLLRSASVIEIYCNRPLLTACLLGVYPGADAFPTTLKNYVSTITLSDDCLRLRSTLQYSPR